MPWVYGSLEGTECLSAKCAAYFPLEVLHVRRVAANCWWDLAHDDGDSSPLPTEVLGLDDAVASWYELEGIEPPVEAAEPAQTQSAGNLPFGYSGESNTHISRLPFGVGSYASGMPFEDSRCLTSRE